MPHRINKWKNNNILIIGDAMIDNYIYGDVDRISPEAPVPVMKVTREEERVGGAGNVAMNVKSLGAQPFLISAYHCGALLDAAGISHLEYGVAKIIKNRIMARHQQLIRFDYDELIKFSEAQEVFICNYIDKQLSDAKAVIISDYGKGTITKRIAQYTIKQSKVPVIIDPKPINKLFYKGAYLITPNLKEAIEMNAHPETVMTLGNNLQKKYDSNIIITQGEEGMTIFQQKNKPIHINSVAKEVYDVTGAGDTVVATLALALSAGIDLYDAAKFANKAAGIVVGKLGTSTITLEELLNA